MKQTKRNLASVWLSRLLIIIALFFAIPHTMLAQTTPALVSIGNVPFNIDGYIERQGSTTGDWVVGTALGTTSQTNAVLRLDGTPNLTNTVSPFVFTAHIRDTFGNGGGVNDDKFDGGDKAFQNPLVWGWTSGSVLAKDDINNAIAHFSKATTGNDIWGVLSVDRNSTNGTSYVDFEFLQKPMAKLTGGSFSSTGDSCGRTPGDILVTVQYTSGGRVDSIYYFTWAATSGNSSCGTGPSYDWVPFTVSAANGFGFSSPTTVNVPYLAFGSSTYATKQVVEIALNITQVISGATSVNPCSGFAFATLFIKSKSSAATTADLKDLIEPIQINLNLGVATVNYGGPFCAPSSGTTPVAVNWGSTPLGIQNGSFSVSPAASGVTVSSSGTLGIGSTASGTYVITYAYSPATGCNKTATDTIVVNPRVTVGVSAPTVCAGSTATVTATPLPAGTYSFAWTIPSGAIPPGNLASFTTTTQGTYSVVATSSTTGCSGTGSANLAFTPNPVSLVLTGSSICASAPGTGTITSSTSQSGVSYQLQDAANANVQAAKAGTGSGLTWSGLAAGNGYHVVSVGAAPTSCPGSSNSVNVTSVANPVALVLTGSSICASAPGTGSVTSSASEIGVNYQLQDGSNNNVQVAKAGTGSGLTWSGLTAGNGYHVVSVGAAPTSCPGSSNSVNVTSVANPVALVLTGSSICASAPGTGSITSSTSQSGVSYQLQDAANANVQAAKAGTGSGLTWNGLAAGNGYHVVSVGAAPTSCPGSSNSVNVTSVANPVALVLTGSSICASAPGTGSVTSSASEAGVSYQLQDAANVNVQAAKAGTGSGLTWSGLAAGNGYHVVSVGAAPTSCPGSSNSVNVTSVANPVALVLTGSSICASAPGTGSVTSSASEIGVNYQLQDGSNNNVQAAKAGTGSGLTWSGLAAGNGYHVVSVGAAPTSCPGSSNSVNVTSVANPVALVLTGSSICASAPGTGSVTSSASEIGVNYQLQDGSNNNVQVAKAGTGSGLTWSGLAAGNGYHVVSVGAAPTSCPGSSNSVNVTSVANPVALVLTGSSICASAPGTGSVTSSASEAGVSYQLQDAANVNVQAAKAGTGSGLTWSGLAAGNGYHVVSVGAAPTSCPGSSNSVNVTSVANPVALVLTGSSICASAPGTGSVTSSASEVGVSYQLQDGSNANVQAAKAGTGSGLTWSGLAAGNGYHVVSVGAAPTSCPGSSNSVNVTSVANPVALVLTGSSICASAPGTGSVTSSASEVGVSYQLQDAANVNVQAAKAGTGSGLTWNGLAAGNGYHVVSVGAAPTSCPGSSNSVNVTSVANPVALVLTGSSICASAPGTGTITSSTSQSGVSYQLQDAANVNVQVAKAGTGSGLTWSGLAVGNGYHVVSVGAAPTSCPGSSNSVNVTSVANPVALVLTGSSICASAPGTGTVTSSASEVGVSYQLQDAANVNVQAAKAGTGSGLTWSALAAGNGYHVVSVGAAPTSCPGSSNSVNVTSVANPVALVLTGSSICASAPGTGSVTSSASEVGVSYQLQDAANNNVQVAKAGTGSGLTWSGLAVGNGYHVISVGAAPTSCPGSSNSVNVTSVANPVALVLTGSSICASAPGTGSVTSSTSQSGVSYQLQDAANVNVQAAKAGTGSGLTWNGLAAGNGYHVVSVGAAPTSCPGSSNSVNVTSVANPVALVLTGSTICSSAPGTGTVTSSASEAGVSYQLQDAANANVQAAKAGTGSGLTWNGLAAGNGYHVVSVGAAPTSCPGSSNSVNVTVNPAATVNAGTDTAICADASVALHGVVGGGATSGTWNSSGSGSFNPNASTLNASYTPSAADKTAGIVRFILTTNDPAGPCDAIADTVVATINALPTVTTADTTVCVGSSAFTLTSGTPVGGTWSGACVSTGMFTCTNVIAANSVVYTYTDANRCTNTDTATVNVINCGITYGTYSQGYYHGTGKSCDGIIGQRTSGINMLTYLLAGDSISIGRNGRSVYMKAGDAAIVNSILPGGGTPGKLVMAGNNRVATSGAFATNYLSKKGTINNVMLSQAISLKLATKLGNVANNVKNFPIEFFAGGDSWFQTKATTDSGCVKFTAVPCTADSFRISYAIAKYLTDSGAHGATVVNLLNLADDLLGGTLTPGGNVPSYGDVTDAMATIIAGFDGWRFWPGTYSTNLNLSCYSAAKGLNVVQSSANGADAIKVYPNPTTGKFVVELPSHIEGGEATIVDLTGKVVQRFRFNPHTQPEFDLSKASQGMYIVEIKNGDKVYRARVVIQQ